MLEISVIVCTHNPRLDYLRRVFGALGGQTLSKNRWEVILVDNASDQALADVWDLSWHPQSKHIRENKLGLTPARLCGIAHAAGEILVFLDDDNVIAPDFLAQAKAIHAEHPEVGAFGAGVLEPEFEVPPPPEIRHLLKKLALRTESSPSWTDDIENYLTTLWGAGLCVCRPVAELYRQFVQTLDAAIPLDRRGDDLYSGGDDMFSWVAVSIGYKFGIFPRLRITHLIAAGRLNQSYFLKLIEDHTYSASVRHYLCNGIHPERINWTKYVASLLHGIEKGSFSMRCRWAALSGQNRAVRFIHEKNLHPLSITDSALLAK